MTPNQLTSSATALERLNSRSARERLVAIAGALLLSAVLLFAQAVDLTHNHDGDLQTQFDCDICLVTGALSDALSAGEFTLDFKSDAEVFHHSDFSLVSHSAVPRLARAPPIS